MMIIIMLILGFVLAIPIGFLLLGLAAAAQEDYKKKARAVLSGEKKMSLEHLAWLSNGLSHIENDLEAADLWHKLQEFRCRTNLK